MVSAHHAKIGQVDLYDDITTDNLLELEHYTGFKNWADELWKLATAMGVGRNFFRGGNVNILLILFTLLKMQCKLTVSKCFTLATPSVFNTFWSGNLRLESSSLHMFLCRNISPDNCARKLLKPLKDSASLHVCNEKIFWFRIFVNDIFSGAVSGLYGQLHLALGPNC